jgi:hypothetical protein
MRKLLTSTIAVGALAVASPAMAASVVFTSGGTNATTSGLTFAGSDGTQVRVTAFSIDTSGLITARTLGQWSGGLGIDGWGDSSHTADNTGTKDFFVLSFSNYVKIGDATFTTDYRFDIGTCCVGPDTDATVGAGMFGTSWVNSLAGQNQSVLNALGLYAEDTTATSDTQIRNINALSRGGTLWLVGASFTDTTPDDAFKFKALTYTVAPPPVPEPSTWALLILGFGGVGAAMRKRKHQAVAFA